MRRGLKHNKLRALVDKGYVAARAAPYEKGTETYSKRRIGIE